MRIKISPCQRFNLLMLTHSDAASIPTGQAGRKYRRFMRRFGLQHIAALAREHGGVRLKTAQDEKTQHIVDVDEEAIEYATSELAARPRTALQEDVLGELFDLLDDLRSGRQYVEPEGEPLNPERDREIWLEG